MHKKISEMPREWPLVRKGRKYIAVPSHNNKKGLPIVFALRDVLNIAKTKREVKKICLEGKVRVNRKIRKDIAFPIQIRDILQLGNNEKNYILLKKNRKFNFKEINETETGTKIVKIIGKKILGKKKFQANLQDGRNFIVKEKFSCGDSLVIDLEKNIISEIISLKKDAKVEIIGGKHIGQIGEVIGTKEKGERIFYEIKMENGRKVWLDKEVLLVIK